MRISKLIAIAGLVAVVPFAQAAAQTCNGTASFANGPMQVSGSWAHSDVVDAFGVGGAYGEDKSWFAGINVGSSKPKGGKSETTYGGTLGWQIAMSDSPAQFCPMVGYSQSSAAGSKGVFDIGASVGYPIKGSDTMDWVPSVGAMYMSTSGSSTTNINLALGLVFNKNLSLVPGFTIPTQSGAKSMISVGLGYNWK